MAQVWTSLVWKHSLWQAQSELEKYHKNTWILIMQSITYFDKCVFSSLCQLLVNGELQAWINTSLNKFSFWYLGIRHQSCLQALHTQLEDVVLEAVVLLLLLLHYCHLAASSVHLEGITMEWKSFTIRNDARFLIIYIRALLADDQNNDNINEDVQDNLRNMLTMTIRMMMTITMNLFIFPV